MSLPTSVRLAATLLLAACGSDPTGTPPELVMTGRVADLAVTPSTLQLTSPGISTKVTATVRYSGVISARSSDPRCATVSPASSMSREKPVGSSLYVAQFTVTPVAVGTCSIGFTDKKGNVVDVGVIVAVARIAFSSNRDLFHEIFLMDPNGQNPTRLTTSRIDGAGEPAWSPDRTKIAFTWYLGNFNTEIYVMDQDGQNPTRLTVSAGDDSKPAWSPDGTRIAFESQRGGFMEIWVMDADGQNPIRLTHTDGSWLDHYPTWSPDGTRIAFQSSRDGKDQIYVMDADGQNQVRLTNNAAIDVEPAWSPDGTRIAFLRVEDPPGETMGEIYVMDADGQNEVRLTNNTAQDAWPAWSPDGAKIAFVRSASLDPFAIWVMDADGQHQTQLTSGSVEDTHPNWR